LRSCELLLALLDHLLESGCFLQLKLTDCLAYVFVLDSFIEKQFVQTAAFVNLQDDRGSLFWDFSSRYELL
jgi:hypothetical protein